MTDSKINQNLRSKYLVTVEKELITDKKIR